jgi:ABC-type uncharacterized transport system substrate-binding protein
LAFAAKGAIARLKGGVAAVMIPRRSMRARARRSRRTAALIGVALLAGLTACQRGERSQPVRPWRVAVLQPDDGVDARQAVEGLAAGLGAAGLQPDRDYLLTVHQAHGQPAALTDLARTAAQGGANTLVAIGTPALQAALAVAPQTPVVFTDVADPALAGVQPRSLWQRWLPWLVGDDRGPVTGAYASGGFTALIGANAQVTSGSWGAVVASSDPDSVGYGDALRAAAQPMGRAVEFELVGEAAEVPAAAARLCTKGVTALVALGDPVTDAAFNALVEAAHACRVPVLGTLGAHAAGATVTVARDTKGAARRAGQLVGRIAAGEDARRIDLVAVERRRLIVNAAAADSAGIGLPLTLVQSADEVIGD